MVKPATATKNQAYSYYPSFVRVNGSVKIT